MLNLGGARKKKGLSRNTPQNVSGNANFSMESSQHKVTSVSGPPGIFLLFNPVSTEHCGVPPANDTKGRKPRAMLELILCPSYESDINPTFNGTNSTHPVSPV